MPSSAKTNRRAGSRETFAAPLPAPGAATHIHRVDDAPGCDAVHDAVEHQWRGFLLSLKVSRCDGNIVSRCQTQFAHIGGVDLLQRAVAPLGPVDAVADPLSPVLLPAFRSASSTGRGRCAEAINPSAAASIARRHGVIGNGTKDIEDSKKFVREAGPEQSITRSEAVRITGFDSHYRPTSIDIQQVGGYTSEGFFKVRLKTLAFSRVFSQHKKFCSSTFKGERSQ